MLRQARDEDADAIIRIVGDCWGEYPGCVTDVDNEVPELRALASYMRTKGGAAWVALSGAGPALVGLVACWPTGEAGRWELGKMYVARAARGSGAAQALLQQAVRYARSQMAAELCLWTDTRFHRAHAFYEKHGFLRAGPIRAKDDRSHTVEYEYEKPLSGVVVRRLNAAAAASAERALADILVACVDAGAAVSFLPPLASDVARGFWHRAIASVIAGRRLLLVAWVGGRLAGAVTLDCDMPPNQPHRTELQKLLVHPEARRRGAGRALLLAAEAAAIEAGRSLITLDTREGDPGEALYRALGYVETGRIPGFALNPDGTLHATRLFYKSLGGQGRISPIVGPPATD